jgi:hypothetical protein
MKKVSLVTQILGTVFLIFVGGFFVYVINNLMFGKLIDLGYLEIVGYLAMLRFTFKTMSADLREIKVNE